MAFSTKTRYGATRDYRDPAAAPTVAEELIVELETEEFDEPDDEHTQVAIGYGNWSLTVQVSGLMTLEDLSAIVGSEADLAASTFFLRAASRSEAKALLVLMAEGRIGEVRKAG